MTDDVGLKLLALLPRELLEELLASLWQLDLLLMLVQQVQHVPHRVERVLCQLHVVIVDALCRIPGRVLQL